jgi:hypothetical protein
MADDIFGMLKGMFRFGVNTGVVYGSEKGRVG